MQVWMVSQRELLLLESGFGRNWAVTHGANVLGLISVPTAARARQLEFEQRSKKRVAFRRNWWRRLTLLLIAGLALASWTAHGSPFLVTIQDMNFKLLLSTKLLLDPGLFIGVVLAFIWTCPPHRHEEDLLESEARVCWQLNTLLAQKVSYPEAMLELSYGRPCPPGLVEILDAAWCQQRVSQVCGLWAQQIEWRLDGYHLARQNRAILLLLILSGGMVHFLFSAVTGTWCCPLIGNLG